ncbi:hypothetical protein RDV84_05780 [Lysobacter yananisis]|uniref:Uncharacterized protein n=2 Tax=Lysobacter TaxID=68 RepID=A0A0S2DAF5_LYSEN|nr:MULTISPECIES: hypothetical protein [Lysobacter]ALN55509.1 hypothetical protein GLE_0150 [Lysobacter enzymogenes]QCW24571.1 hypothetical protein FE772_01650 [Lysobacter enzymogenes]UZW60462.1 hypothetical protein BV903_024920 [Lysobacter enzymogenes]WMT04346.1 hypothetical protein RDV84_05780 [Lysobacter yananisis]
MTQLPFADAESSPFQGWRRVFVAGAQVAPRFLDERGAYRYGLFELAAASVAELERELVQADPSSALNFAVIDTTAADWSPQRTGAFRQDLDFYLFTGATAQARDALREYLDANAPVAVLCMATPLG